MPVRRRSLRRRVIDSRLEVARAPCPPGVSPMPLEPGAGLSLTRIGRGRVGRDGLEGERGGEGITLRDPDLAVGEQRLSPGRPRSNPCGPPRRTRAPRPHHVRWSATALPERARSRPRLSGGLARTALSCDRRTTARYWNIACPHPAVCCRSRACSASRAVDRLLIRRGGDRAGEAGSPAPRARLPAAAPAEARSGPAPGRARWPAARPPPAAVHPPGRPARRRAPPSPAPRRPPRVGWDPHRPGAGRHPPPRPSSPRVQGGRAGLGPHPRVQLVAAASDRYSPERLRPLPPAVRLVAPALGVGLTAAAEHPHRSGDGGSGRQRPQRRHPPVRPSIAR